jgi:serine/threonine protein kinase
VHHELIHSLRNSKLVSGDLPTVERAMEDLGGEPEADELIAYLVRDEAHCSWRLPAAVSLVASIVNFGYRIIEPIGRGGGGRVFLVTKGSEVDKPYALKVLQHDDFDDADALERAQRFVREVDALRKMTGVAVPELREAKTDGKHPLFVMEFIPGENLGQLLHRTHKLPPSIALPLILQAAMVIDELARNRFVHRDIKPDNLILDKTGKLWVVDFGLARKDGSTYANNPTGRDAFLGTECFMSPEQRLYPSKVDSRADIFSLGCTLYFLMEGKCPRDANPSEKERVLHHPDLCCAVDGSTVHVLAKMLAESREERLAPEHLLRYLRLLITDLRRRQATLLDDTVENLCSLVSALGGAQTETSHVYDAADRQWLLLQLEDERCRERIGSPLPDRLIKQLADARHINAVQIAALSLLAGRGGVILQIWYNEPLLVVRYQRRSTQRVHVLKIVPIGQGDDPSNVSIDEHVRTVQGLVHPNVAPLNEVGRHGSMLFFDMDFIDGKDLITHRREVGTPSWHEITGIFGAVLSGLAAFHERGVAHGDIQPSSVIIPTPDSRPGAGVAVLVGFGNKLSASQRDDLRELGNLLEFLIGGRERVEPMATVVRQAYDSKTHGMPDGIAQLLDLLLSESQEVTLANAIHAWSQLASAMRAPSQTRHAASDPADEIILDHAQCLQLLHGLGGRPEILPHDEPLRADDRVPNFLLFRSAGRLVMAVVAEGASVHPFALRKTGEIETEATLLAVAEVEKLGFQRGEVHTSFVDPLNRITNIIIDATLVAHAILDRTASVVIPGIRQGEAVKFRTTLDAWLNAVFRLHGTRKVFFANIARDKRPDEKLMHLFERSPIRTRFAPTPSGGLHLGNARTALISFLVALRSGLTHARNAPCSFFHLRLDDTDWERCRPGAEDEIKGELRWLGLIWDDKQQFSQADKQSITRYNDVERALRVAGLLGHDPVSHVSYLNLDITAEHDYGGYYNLLFDLKRGPLIFHIPPVDRRQRTKTIALSRSDGTPFYRFAGVVDDTARTTIAFRDVGQFDLSMVQSHIRHGIERARQWLQSSKPVKGGHNRRIDDFLRTLGMEHLGASVPLVVYGHLQVLVDDQNARLSKRSEPGGVAAAVDHGEPSPFTLRALRDAGVAPESVLAYLLTTILPPNWRGIRTERRNAGSNTLDSQRYRLLDLVHLFAHAGLRAALFMLAPDIDLRHLVQSSKNIRCHLRRIQQANRWFIDALPTWRYPRLFDEDDAPARSYDGYPNHDSSPDTRLRIYGYRHDFADFRQIRAVVGGPLHYPSDLGDGIRNFVARARALPAMNERDEPATLVEQIKRELQLLREAACASPDVHDGLCEVLRELRQLLTGAEASPKIETILNVLDPAVVCSRLGPLARGADPA